MGRSKPEIIMALSCINYLITQLKLNTEDDLIKKIVESALFFPETFINEQIDEMISKQSQPLPQPLYARWSTKASNYKVKKKVNLKKLTKNKAHRLTVSEEEYRKSTQGKTSNYDDIGFLYQKLFFKISERGEIPVIIDKDGNTEPRNMIRDFSGFTVSQGSKTNDLVDYSIVHLWGNAIHPLYFNSPWNLVIMPSCYSFLTDKNTTFSIKLNNSMKKYIWDRHGEKIKKLFEKYNECPPKDINGEYVEIGKVTELKKVDNQKV